MAMQEVTYHRRILKKKGLASVLASAHSDAPWEWLSTVSSVPCCHIGGMASAKRCRLVVIGILMLYPLMLNMLRYACSS